MGTAFQQIVLLLLLELLLLLLLQELSEETGFCLCEPRSYEKEVLEEFVDGKQPCSSVFWALGFEFVVYGLGR